MQSSSSSASASLTYPQGFRFVPTDAELIYYYLKPFSLDNNKSWTNPPIHRANIYESNPQQLSAEYKKGNLTEWFFISERTKIKRDGTNQKRVDNNGGYWHGKAVSKKIKATQGVVGYKTTLNYYVGKQPNGVKTDWLMQEYWLESSDHNKTMVDHALCKIYLSPTARKNKNEEDDEAFEEEVEYQQPQLYPTPTPLVSHQPQRHDIAYQEPHQPHPLDTLDHYQSQRQDIEHQEPLQAQPLSTIHYHHDISFQEPHQVQPQTLVTIDYHQPQRHHIEPYQTQPLDITIHYQSHQLPFWQATQGSHQTQPHDLTYQLQQFWPAPLDSYPPHSHDIQYPQPQPLDAIEYQYLYQSGPLTTYGNMIESSTDQDKSNGDSKKVDHALKIHLTPRGVKREAEEEVNEKRKEMKEEEIVETSKEELDDDEDSFFTGFIEPHEIDIDIEAINSCCLKKSSDKD